jgi:hypothetical protein
MKYLDDKNSVSKQELKESANAANAAYAVADAAAAVAADAAANAAAYAANAAANAANAAYAAYAVAEKWINRYFDHTKEDKQTYIDAINAGKESKEMKSDRLADEIMEKGKEAVYTREMFNKSEIPKVGMKALYDKAEVIIVGFKRSGAIVFEYKLSGTVDAICMLSGNKSIKPIDTRTDSEKAIDDLMSKIGPVHYDAHMGNMSLKDVVKFAVELIEKGDVTGISFTGDKK